MPVKNLPDISDEFPGWHAWQSLGSGQLHARQLNAVPTVILHDDTIDGLCYQIRATFGITVARP